MSVLCSILANPNFVGNYFGAKVFVQKKNKQYCLFAYIISGIAAITGLPVWE